jgi:hypothetical protein
MFQNEVVGQSPKWITPKIEMIANKAYILEMLMGSKRNLFCGHFNMLIRDARTLGE